MLWPPAGNGGWTVAVRMLDMADSVNKQPLSADAARSGSESAGGSPPDECEVLDPDALADRLVRLAPTLTVEEQQRLAGRLQQSELFASTEAPRWDDQAGAALLAKLRLALDKPLDPARMQRLLPALVEFALSLDEVVWATWEEAAPDSDIRRKESLQQQLAQFVTGDEGVSRADVAEGLGRLRQLVAALLAAIGQVCPQWAAEHGARTSPEEIEKLARAEKPWHEGLAVACWRTYKEVAGSTDPAAIDRDIRQAIAECAAAVIKGRDS